MIASLTIMPTITESTEPPDSGSLSPIGARVRGVPQPPSHGQHGTLTPTLSLEARGRPLPSRRRGSSLFGDLPDRSSGPLSPLGDRARVRGFLIGLVIGLAGCANPAATDSSTEAPAPNAGSWSVTAWGPNYEVFPEVEPLVAGEPAIAHTHVTRLDDFTALVEGRVEIVLSGSSGEQVFGSDQPIRPGIFNIEIRPDAPGELDLAFRITTTAGSEEIGGGRVRVGAAQKAGGVGATQTAGGVGAAQKAGGLVVAPAPKGASDGGEPLAFLKEEQWRSDFSTTWVRNGSLARSVSGLARVRPPAGGDAVVTSPVDGVLHPTRGAASWPFTGHRVDRGTPLFRVVPRVAVGRSFAALEAELATIEAEQETAQARLARLQELLALEATSQRQVEDARARALTLEAKHVAAKHDLAAAHSSREGGTAGGMTLRAPIRGEVAKISASPGATVTAGEPLARLVRTDRLWLEVALSPDAARQLPEEGINGVVLSDAESSPVRIDQDLRLVSVAPELSPRTGTVTALLEAPSHPDLTLGTTLEAQILLSQQRAGVVIPASALVDDGGVAIVYLQLSGESFVRQAVDVIERQGDLLLVDRLTPGQRLVDRGGEAIRRSSLMASGAGHGHVH